MPTLLETKVETRRFIFPGQANAGGTAHGGDLVKWMEQVGGMSTMRFAGADTVTVGMENVKFHRPIPEGSIALLDAYVYRAGESSITARVRGYDEDRHTGDRELATEASVISVGVDDDGGTIPAPALSVDTDDGESLRADALDSET